MTTANAIMLTDPVGMTWEAWSSEFAGNNLKFGLLPEQVPEAEWLTFANALMEDPLFTGMHPPIPGFFPDWKTWATALLECLHGYF